LLLQLQTIREQEEARDKNMFKYVLFLWLICIFIVVFSSGFAKSSTGKVDLSSRSVPGFLRTETTTEEDVLENIGEPFGYREQGNRSGNDLPQLSGGIFQFIIHSNTNGRISSS